MARIRARLKNEDGQVLILMVIAMVAMLLFMAYAIDTATLMVARHKVQVAADAGALAAAHDLETGTVTNATVTTDGQFYATQNDGSASANISQPGVGNEAAAKVTQSVPLPFGGIWGTPSDTVGATATAQVVENQAQIQDGEAYELTPSSYSGECTASTYCEIDADQACASQTNENASAYGGYFFYGPNIFDAAHPSGWNIYTGYNTSNATGNCASVDVQNCNGAVGGNCLDSAGNQITTDEVVDLNGDSTGGMYQTVATTAGGHYVMSFYLTGNPAGESCSQDTFTGYVQVNDQTTTGTQLAKQTFSHTNPCSGGSETAQFQEVTVPFIAKSASTVLILESTTCMSAVGGSDTCSGNLWDFGPEVTDISMAAPSVVLAQ
jgi:Flp pilus assembly protein TadG